MKSPQGILSESIAQALAEYFVIDPHHVETHLFSNAGITLSNVQLKPIPNLTVNDSTKASLTGSVDSVAFTWKWGKSLKEGGSAFVNSAVLTVRGPVLQAILRHEASDPVPAVTATTTVSPETKKKKPSAVQRFVQDQMQRIFDTLTLTVTGLECQIRLQDSKEILTAGIDSLSIESLGRASEELPLEQTLNLSSLYCRLLQSSSDGSDTTTPMPILEDFSYQASAVRLAGANTIDRGVTLVGQTNSESSNDGAICLHAGPTQLAFLNQLGGYLLSNNNRTTTAPDSSASNSEEKEKDLTEKPVETPDTKEPLPASTFSLPLQALSLVFPNGTKLSVASLQLQYHLDGSVLELTGRDGIAVNDNNLLQLPEPSSWKADLVASHFCVETSGVETGDESVATIQARDTEVQKIQQGLAQLVGIAAECETFGAGQKLANASSAPASSKPSESSEPKPSTPWTVSIDGGLAFLWQEETKTVVDGLLRQVQVSHDEIRTTLTVGLVERLLVPGTLRLTEPLQDTRLIFDGSLLEITLGQVVAKLEEPPETQKVHENEDDDEAKEQLAKLSLSESVSEIKDDNVEKQQDTPTDNGAATAAATKEPFVLPFSTKASMESITIFQVDGTTQHTVIQALQFAAGPHVQGADDKTSAPPTGGVRVVLLLDEIKHDMVCATDLQLSAVMDPNEGWETVHAFDAQAKGVAIATGYSVFAWKRLLETGDEKRKPVHDNKQESKPLKLPYCHVHALHVRVAVKGELIGTDGSVLHFRDFQGTERTTSHDLVAHYTKSLLANVPGVVTNANVLGFNVADTASSQAGIYVATGALGALGGAAAPVAGVLGMVGLDGLKGTMQAGKRARGANPDDTFHVTDFLWGVGQAAKDAARGGATRRGKTAEDKASALDWAVGATSDVAAYTVTNKSRLGGAGAGTLGFAYGMMLGGPVGAVAGAIIASKSTSATIDAIDSKFATSKKPVDAITN